MPRRWWVLVESGLYHVYNRFAHGEGVFADTEEAVEFAELIREAEARDGLTRSLPGPNFQTTSTWPCARRRFHSHGR